MAAGVTRIARDIAFTLEKKSTKIFENIFLNNGVLAALGMKGRVKIVRGGDQFHERVHLGQNSTVGHRNKFTQIPTDMQNNFRTAKYGQAVVSGAAVLNLVEEDQNAGEQKISDMAEALVEEAQLTFPNKVAEALMKATSTSVDPESIVERIEATAFGAQTSSLGGIARSSYASLPGAWQNQYNADALADLGAAAGIALFSKFLWTCSPGGAALSEQPDVVLTTTGVYAKATGGGDANRRYSVNDRMLKLGFTNIQINNAAILADANVTNAGYAYAINTNYLRMQILAGSKTKTIGSVKTIGDGKQSIQLQIRPPIESDDYLNFVIKMYMVYNLTFGGLRQHGLKTTITEA